VVSGKKSFDVRTDDAALALATQTDVKWPWVVWCVARTPGGRIQQ